MRWTMRKWDRKGIGSPNWIPLHISRFALDQVSKPDPSDLDSSYFGDHKEERQSRPIRKCVINASIRDVHLEKNKRVIRRAPWWSWQKSPSLLVLVEDGIWPARRDVLLMVLDRKTLFLSRDTAKVLTWCALIEKRCSHIWVSFNFVRLPWVSFNSVRLAVPGDGQGGQPSFILNGHFPPDGYDFLIRQEVSAFHGNFFFWFGQPLSKTDSRWR